MDTPRKRFLARAALVLAACCPSIACDGGDRVAVTRQPLRAQCAEVDASLPDGAWVCPDPLTVECTGGQGTTDVELIYVVDPLACDGPLVVSDTGPFAPGTYGIAIDDDIGARLCVAELTVVDSAPPELESHTVTLWPPNHSWHAIDVAQCVSARDACDGELRGEFIWASSDEPIDARGDGHHAPDVRFDDCDSVAVRAERQGPGDGRVYTLGVRVTDASGNSAEGQCNVVVAHDQRGVPGVDSGEAYRVELDGADGRPACGRAGEADDAAP